MSMNVSPMAADYHLENTKAFIAQNPVTLAIARRPRIADGAGGWRHGSPFAAGTPEVRLVGYTGQDGGSSQRVNESGAVVTVVMNLIAMPDTAILPGDQFRLEGWNGFDPDVLYEVLTTNRTPPWRLEAAVYAHGV